MSQLTAAVTTGSPSTRPSQRKRCAATSPGCDRPDGRVDGAVATAISCVVRKVGIEVEAELVGHHVDRLAEAGAERLGHDARRDSSGVLPNSIQSRMTSGAP